LLPPPQAKREVEGNVCGARLRYCGGAQLLLGLIEIAALHQQGAKAVARAGIARVAGQHLAIEAFGGLEIAALVSLLGLRESFG
jgi:hypothetical protein